MSPQEFLRRHDAEWTALEALLADPAALAHDGTLPGRYRRLCQHLALARVRHYPPALVDRLNHLVVNAHHQLYRSRPPLPALASRFLMHDFPALVRAHATSFWLSAFLLYGSMLVTGLAVYFHPALVYSIMPANAVHNFENMYDPARRVIGFDRDDASDLFMFGYYIRNNIGIGFQTFAGGIFGGLGSFFILVMNGITMGAVAGHLTGIGYTSTFWSFVAGHGAFELTAIILTGSAGLQLGYALIAPGRLSRGDALRQQARVAVQLVYGATLFLVIAAMLEAFWSSNTLIPVGIKYAVAACLWTSVALYFLVAGRARDADR